MLGAVGAGVAMLQAGSTVAEPDQALKPITGEAKPISPEERQARLEKVRTLMAERGIGALLVEPGSS
ncbi:MAG TPA: hypothetical protein VH353_03815, partial [Caulobacteraceae bacterium]|nr:hypothetical protein [Caulobacteraceae bacterium]